MFTLARTTTRLTLHPQDDCIEKLRQRRPFWREKRFWGVRLAMLAWATLFESGWKPYGLRLCVRARVLRRWCCVGNVWVCGVGVWVCL